MQSANDQNVSVPQTQPQSLESQNIFFLLGAQDSSKEEQDSFLDELQQVIWEDFLEKDLAMLLTDAELAEAKELLVDKDSEAGQAKIMDYLTKKIPDLEEIMMDKALELKSDLFKERLAGLREYFSQDGAKLDRVDEASRAMKDNRWTDAAAVLNSL